MEQRLILLVEDDDDLRALVRLHLRASGYRTVEAGTVSAALAALGRARPDAVVLDIHLPDGTGWDVARAVRNAGDWRLPLVVCSSVQPPADLFASCAIAGFVHKPFTSSVLIDSVKSALDGAAAEAAPRPVLVASAETEDEKAAFYASLAHDMRTPMATFRTAVESLLASDVEWDRETQREFLEVIAASGERISKYARDLVDLARLDAGALCSRPTRLDPSEMSELLLRHAGANGIGRGAVRLRVAPDAQAAWGDIAHVQRVLAVFLENGLSFSPPGSPILVEARADGPRVQWRVSDRGPGIPPEDRERVFDRHYRMRPDKPNRSGGPEISLHLCRELARLQGGRVWVEAAEGGGACFVLCLPAAPPHREDN